MAGMEGGGEGGGREQTRRESGEEENKARGRRCVTLRLGKRKKPQLLET